MNTLTPPTKADDTTLPLVVGNLDRVFAWRGARSVTVGEFLAQARAVAGELPDCARVLNLCEDRYRFLLGFCAALIRGLPTLLPPGRSPELVRDLSLRYDGIHAVGDADGLSPALIEALPIGCTLLPEWSDGGSASSTNVRIASDQLAAIGFTSGSTGPPTPQTKYWGSFAASTALNADCLFTCLADMGETTGGANLLATIPAQHMYGMETSVLLPLLANVSIHAGRPFFPADIASALVDLPTPRVLVTTPVHLKALIDSGQSLPPLAVIISAAAPLSAELAQAAETATGARVLELFGSTETCILGYRHTAHESDWTAYAGVQLLPDDNGTRVEAHWLAEPMPLQDRIEWLPDRRFRLLGRLSDHLQIAGKRASLAELTRRLLAIDGVEDAAMFQLDAQPGNPVQRIAALVVAPQRSEADLLSALRLHVDPVFLPRPLRRVQALPRNATGKLPRQALLDALRAAGSDSD